MSSAEEYHQYARECIEAAATCSDEVQRQAYLEMAKTWENAALAVKEQTAHQLSGSAASQG
jgi:hypothetical protein